MSGLPDTHVTTVVFSGATEDMLEIFLRTGAKTAAGGEHNRDEKGIALIMLNNSRDSGAATPLALTCADDAQTPRLASLNWADAPLPSEPLGGRSPTQSVI